MNDDSMTSVLQYYSTQPATVVQTHALPAISEGDASVPPLYRPPYVHKKLHASPAATKMPSSRWSFSYIRLLHPPTCVCCSLLPHLNEPTVLLLLL
jgi:hypothetical protein